MTGSVYLEDSPDKDIKGRFPLADLIVNKLLESDNDLTMALKSYGNDEIPILQK
jgi:hypothetical protein